MGHPSIPEFGPTPQHASTAEGEEDKEEGGGEAKQAGRPQARGGLGRLGEGRRRAEGARGEGF